MTNYRISSDFEAARLKVGSLDEMELTPELLLAFELATAWLVIAIRQRKYDDRQSQSVSDIAELLTKLSARRGAPVNVSANAVIVAASSLGVPDGGGRIYVSTEEYARLRSFADGKAASHWLQPVNLSGDGKLSERTEADIAGWIA